jgi:hypothetical protein
MEKCELMNLVCCLCVLHVRTQNFSLGGGGADPEAIYNLCLILKIMLQNHVVNIT